MRRTILIFIPVLIFKIGVSQNDNCKQMRLFEKLWTKIDKNYASFDIKGINWQESYNKFKPKITADLNQDQLIDTIELMLKPLNDGHVGVVKLRFFPLRISKGFSAERESYYYKAISDNPFTGTVIILTNDRTRSAGENFVMSMMDLPNVTIIGDRTEGILGEAKIGILPYGWIYGVNNYKILTPDGINYEDIGIPPDYPIQNRISDIKHKKDPLIEKAIELIEN